MRGFAGWPGTSADLVIRDISSGKCCVFSFSMPVSVCWGNEEASHTRHCRQTLDLACTSFSSGSTENVEVKIVRTQALDSDTALNQGLQSLTGAASADESSSEKGKAEQQGGLPVAWVPDTGDMLVPCQGGKSVLRVCVVQPPTKKAIAARDFRNGLRGKEVLLPGGVGQSV